MQTKSFKTGAIILLAVIMLISIIPISAMAATFNDEGNITSTYLTLYRFAYGNTVMSATAGGELGVVFVNKTTFYESEKEIPTSREDLVETADSYFQAGKQYFCAIDFSEHPDLSIDPENSHYFARELTVTLTCNNDSCEPVLDLSENSKVFVYKLPVLEAIPYGIDVTVSVEQGGNVAPTTGTFELEVLNTEKASNLPIDSFTIGNTTVSTNGTGNFDSKLTIGHNDYEKLFYLSYEGVLVKQKKGTAAGWTYDESVWFVKLHQDPVVNALTDDAAETMPNIKFDCFKGKMVDDEFVPDDETPEEKVTFTNTYTENVDPVITVKIPFTKKVTLGGDIAPTGETFKLNIFDIGNGNADEYADVTYTAEVKVTGEGEFEGQIIITGPESQVEQYICEGFFVREVKGTAENWTYSDAVWCVVPEWNEQQQRVFAAYPTTKETSDNGEYYAVAEKAADKMVFENIYTENTPVETPPTGDNSMISLWFALLFVSGIGVAVTKKKSVR